jgi:hypothetical protein
LITTFGRLSLIPERNTLGGPFEAELNDFANFAGFSQLFMPEPSSLAVVATCGLLACASRCRRWRPIAND